MSKAETTRCAEAGAGGNPREHPGCATPTSAHPNRDFHFHLICWDDEVIEGTLDLDEGQLWIEPDGQQIIISLSGAQLQQLTAWPSARARTKS